jgi:hypothetical protein
MNNDNPVEATGPVADAPAPVPGAGQAAADQAEQAKKSAEDTGVTETISSVVEGVCDVADIASSILSIFDT